MITLVCDIDGCLVDFTAGYIQRIIEVTGEDLFGRDKEGWDKDFPPVWDYPQETYGYTGKQIGEVWRSIKKDPTFWEALAPLPGTADALAKLARMRGDGHNVYFVTARPGVSAKLQTEQWLLAHGMANPTVIICEPEQKAALSVILKTDALIEDKLATANHVMGTVRLQKLLTRVYLVDCPYNNRDVAVLKDQQYEVRADERDPALVVVAGVSEALEREGL